MRLVERHEVLESVFVEMDPILDGFRGVLLELLGVAEGYVLLETAVGTGKRLLEFRTRRLRLARSILEADPGYSGLWNRLPEEAPGRQRRQAGAHARVGSPTRR